LNVGERAGILPAKEARAMMLANGNCAA